MYEQNLKIAFIHFFVICCSAAALPMYRLLIHRSSLKCNAPSVHFLAVPQSGSQHRDRNTTTATYRNQAAVDYKQGFTLLLSLTHTPTPTPLPHTPKSNNG